MGKYVLSKKFFSGKYRGFIIEPQIQNFLTGRIWIEEHFPFSKLKVESYIKRQLIQRVPGISVRGFPKRYKCNRCLNENRKEFVRFECAKCERECVYCRHCINMGRISSCTSLLIWTGPKPVELTKHTLRWEGKYSQEQSKSAKEVVESLRLNRNHLLHAVCGSGKTEMMFPVIYEALTRNYRVCVATPRTDVVLELYPRLQKVFPNTNIHPLYGNAPKQKGYAPLIIATTHQLYRFQDAFDYCIVDEADAFPYTFDKTLQKAVEKSKKKEAPMLLVTATPANSILSKVKKEKWGHSYIPKRYHGHPLPVPRFQSLWYYEKTFQKGKVPMKLYDWTKNCLKEGKPFLIFFPSIALMEQAAPLFKEIHEKIESVHAEDPNRKEKVLALRNQEVPGLLTTTILERGITITNLQVAVVGSEAPIFSSSALIQISGRVGRNVNYPTGDIVFFHHGISTAMDEAKEEIEKLNKEGFPQLAQK